MEFGIQVGGDYSLAVTAARWAEKQGLAAYARADHYLVHTMAGKDAGLYDTLIILAGLARATERIELVVLVSPITFRHPSVLAKQSATIDHMSGGRFTLGLGTGWLEEEHRRFGIPYPPWPERWERLEEALRYLRAAFGKAPPGFSGKHYYLDAKPVEPAPTGDLPLMVGGFGPKRSPYLGGTYADEYNLALLVPIDDLEIRIERAREAAVAAGRSPEAVRISAMGTAIVASDRTTYRKRLEEGAAYRRMDPDDLEASFAECSLPHGTPDQVAEQMARLAEAGVSRFYLQAIGAWDEELMAETFELLGR
ncbi:MAG: LLM class flavin-dependent oxidoreductase [bacterium]|nr:LLM class flavin-dependent oxidoreductase [bacterium]